INGIAYELASSAPTTVAGNSHLNLLQKKLRSLGADYFIIEVTKILFITEEANQIQARKRILRGINGYDSDVKNFRINRYKPSRESWYNPDYSWYCIGYAKNKGEVEEPRPFLSIEKNPIQARELLIWIQRSILDKFPFLLKNKDGNTNVAPLNQFLSRHRITLYMLRKIGADHASRVHGVEHYGVMNNRPNTPAPKQENNEDKDSDEDSDTDYQQSRRALNMSQVLIRRLINFERVMRRKIKPTYCFKMVYLRLEGLKISDALISAILHLYPDIRFLILDKSKGFTNIPIIEIARFSLKLQHLSLNSYICLTNRCITEITRSCSKLRHLELGDCSIGNEAIEEIAGNCTNLKYLSLKGCRRIRNEVLKNLNLKIKIEHPDYSDDEFSDSDLPPLIPIFTGRQNGIAITRSFRDYYLSHTSDETDLISAIVNYLRENPPTRFNTISKSLFDKLKEDYRICDPVENLYGDVIGEIKCLDLQFCYKVKWRSLDAKIGFRFSSEINDFYAKIVIDGMSIPLIEEGSRPIALEETTDMFKKLSLRSKDDKQQKRRHGIFRNIPPQENKVKYSTDSDTSSNSDTLDSNL
ncbi:24752_t:CDS:2, partial [Dentiscutata erythropus]